MDELDWRGLRLADVAAAANLMARAEQVDQTGENFSAADLEEEWADEAHDLTRDYVGVFDGEAMVAIGQVLAATEVWDEHLVGCPGTVHPDYRGRGLGTKLVRWQLQRAAEVHAERHPTVPGRASFGVADHVAPAVALARDSGLVSSRQFFDMERELFQPMPVVRPPVAPLRVVAFDWARDDEVRRAHNEAFRGHYGSTQREPASWKQWFTGNRNFRAELSFLVLDGPGADAEVTAYLLGYFYEADLAATGIREAWIGQLGTRRAFRGRGAGSALLGHALEAYRDLGYAKAALDVDSENGTGALGLYQRVGFEVSKSWTSWEQPLPPATG